MCDITRYHTDIDKDKVYAVGSLVLAHVPRRFRQRRGHNARPCRNGDRRMKDNIPILDMPALKGILRYWKLPVWVRQPRSTAADVEFIISVRCPRGFRANKLSYYTSRRWRWLRAAVITLAGGKCADCDARATEVHHKSYRHFRHEWLDELEPLCQKCHTKRHPDHPARQDVLVEAFDD